MTLQIVDIPFLLKLKRSRLVVGYCLIPFLSRKIHLFLVLEVWFLDISCSDMNKNRKKEYK